MCETPLDHELPMYAVSFHAPRISTWRMHLMATHSSSPLHAREEKEVDVFITERSLHASEVSRKAGAESCAMQLCLDAFPTSRGYLRHRAFVVEI